MVHSQKPITLSLTQLHITILLRVPLKRLHNFSNLLLLVIQMPQMIITRRLYILQIIINLHLYIPLHILRLLMNDSLNRLNGLQSDTYLLTNLRRFFPLIRRLNVFAEIPHFILYITKLAKSTRTLLQNLNT